LRLASDINAKRVVAVRVVQVQEFGGPEVLQVRTVPDVEAGPGQAVVEVIAVSVLWVDTMIRRGHGGDFFPVQPPYVPGVGVAGRVTSVGEGVDHGWVGQRVLAELTSGGYAEQVVTEVERLTLIPDALGQREAISLLHDGSTALAVFETMKVQPGETVLIQPAGGALGSLLVQLAHAAGARVIAAARGEEKLTLAKELGADVVVDYSQPGWTAQVGTVDIAFDGVGGKLGKAAFETVTRGGRYSNYGNASGAPTIVSPEHAQQRGVTVLGMEQLMGYGQDRAPRLERVLQDAAAGRLRLSIGATYPLERAADAHMAIENRSLVGKSLLIP
jgi:NADPH2:quinone reductase